jgi:predicted transposase YbfD/YdcC
LGQQVNRRAATKKAVFRRLRDAELSRLPDRRDRRGRRHPYLGLVYALMLGCVSALRSLRDVERQSDELSVDLRRTTGIRQRISDTTLRDALLALEPSELRPALHRQVKAEHRRGNLKPVRLPIGLVAIDGKCLAKLDRWDHPNVQPVRPDGRAPYGLARVHGAHLVSSMATVCIDRRGIPGSTNEMGAVCDFTRELLTTYKRTGLFEAIIADAGNGSLEHASLIHDNDLAYILAIKQPAGDIHSEANRLLAERSAGEAEQVVTRREKGGTVTHRLWRVAISGFLSWGHARQLVRVERTVNKDNAETTGNRYFATNLPQGRLKGAGWLAAIRLYWRCENNGHWIADVVWKEDARRTPWTTDPKAVFALGLLRMIALNVIAILRAMSRRSYCSKRPPWADIIQALRFLLAPPATDLGERLDFE